MDDTIVCDNCGSETTLNPGISTCPICGTAFSELISSSPVVHADAAFADCPACAAQPASDSALECAACGTLTDSAPGAVAFCRHCDAMLTTDVE